MKKSKAKKILFKITMKLKVLESKKSELRAKAREVDDEIKDLTRKYSKIFKKLGVDEISFKHNGKTYKSELKEYSGYKYDPEKLEEKLSDKVTLSELKSLIIERDPKIDKKFLDDLFDKGKITLEDIEGAYEEYETRRPKVKIKEDE